MASTWTYDPRLRELLVAFMKMAKEVKRPYAVGGALAMAAQGYARQTTDLDAFLLRQDALAWFRAARAQGLSVSPVFEGHHYFAWMRKHGDPEVRIDLMFPSEEIYLSGVREPKRAKIGDVASVVLPIELVAAAKFTSDRDKDRLDFDAMLRRGLFEPETAAFLLRAAGDRAEARALLRHAAAVEASLAQTPKKTKR
jgi:hypothetical protein